MSSSAEELGKVIGNLIQAQQITSQNRNGAVVKTIKRRSIYEDIKVPGQIIFTKKVPASDSFILDHPVQGELDSAVYKLDGGWDASQEVILEIQNF